MEQGLPYFVNPRKDTGKDHDSDQEWEPQSALTFTKEPVTPTKRNRHDPEAEFTYPSPPRGSAVVLGTWVHPDPNGRPPPRRERSSQPLPPHRIQQPTPLPGSRSQPQFPPPISSNSLHSGTIAATAPLSSAPPAREASPPFPHGAKVGQPIPPHIAAAANAIQALARNQGAYRPSRSDLKSRANGQAIREHFISSTGLMRLESELREWYGDSRLFPIQWWEFFVWQKPKDTARSGVEM